MAIALFPITVRNMAIADFAATVRNMAIPYGQNNGYPVNWLMRSKSWLCLRYLLRSKVWLYVSVQFTVESMVKDMAIAEAETILNYRIPLKG